MTFNSLNIIDPILRSLKEEGYSTPTEIQEQAIPIALQGRDLLGCAQTGTGKTAAFAIPILQQLEANRSSDPNRNIRSLIVTPTRELAIQIDESFQNYGRHTGLTTAVVYGGVNQKRQVKQLKKGVDILTATPGRLLDLMNQGFISLAHIEIFVLDEADRMLDMGFIHDIKKMLRVLPKNRQTLFFSATMPNEIVQLSKSILKNPTKIEVTPEAATVDKIRQGIFHVEKNNKKQLLVDVLSDDSVGSALVFTRTKRGANNVVKMLNKKSIQAEAIHGNKSQNARQRALSNFKDQSTRVLVATDIAARGIDVDELKYVINYEIPNIPETYVHRIGRTGRAGSDGTALSFVDSSEREFLRDIEKLINQQIPVVDEKEYEVRAEKLLTQEVPQSHLNGSNGNHSKNGKRPRPKSSGKRRGSRR